MANELLGTKAIGSIVKLKVNGALWDFIVVHQGLLSSIYDESCNGTWLLMKDCYERRNWHSSAVNDYAGSDIHSYLNSSFFNLFDSDLQAQIQQVKIPYRPGSCTNGTVLSGANGLSAKIFLLSDREVGYTKSNVNSYICDDGAKLAYFNDNNGTSEKIAYLNGQAADWWLRSPSLGNSNNVWYAGAGGGAIHVNCSWGDAVRPALILPSSLLLSDTGDFTINTAPIVICSQASGTNLSLKNAGFSVDYGVADPDGDAVTVTEAIDGENLRSFQAVPDETYTFTVSSETFMKVLNGEHALTITASDGKADTVHRLLFQKEITSALITLVDAVPADARIAVCVLSVSGSIPADAHFEDCTNEVRTGANHVFANETQINGWAFNFKVTASRGPSDQGGYINSVQGGFQ